MVGIPSQLISNLQKIDLSIKIGLLNKWKVNGDYNLEQIRKEDVPQKPYITDDAKGFYRYYIKSYDEINRAYNEVERLKSESLM